MVLTVKQFCKVHWIAIILAMCAGLALVLPQIIFMRQASYRGIDIMGSDAETHYVAMMREFYDHNYAGNPFLAEFKISQDSPYFTPVALLITTPGKLFNISVQTLNIIYKFLFPVVIFLLAYGLIWRITSERLVSMSGASLIVLGYNIVTISGLVNLFHWNYAYHQFGLYARPINPEVSGIVFFVFLHLVYSLSMNIRRRDIVWMGVILGCSFYVYFYLWTFLYMVCGAFFLWCLWRKKSIFPIIYASVIGAVIGAPVLYFSLKTIHSPFYASLSGLLGVVHSHVPVISTLGCLVLLALSYMGYKNFKFGKTSFLWIILAGAFISMLQNVITGLNLQDGHYHWYFSVPIFSLILVIAVVSLTEKYPVLKKVILTGIIGLASLNVCLVQASSYAYWSPVFTSVQPASNAFTWLQTNTPNNSVVLSNEFLSELLPIYTHNNVFWNPYAAFYLMPVDSIESRLSYYLNLEGYVCGSKDNLKQISLTNQDIKAFVGVGVINVYPDNVCQIIASQPKNTPELDYLFVDVRHDHWKIPIGAKVVYNQNPYTIYKVK